MTEEVLQTQNTERKTDSSTHGDSLATLKKIVNDSTTPAFLCTSIKTDNPNYLSIIMGNKSFCDEFEILQEDLIGNSYDFLFDNIDINYSSEDQLEYIRLIKAIKAVHDCSIIIKITYRNKNDELQEAKFKIDFNPVKDEVNGVQKIYAIFLFEKIGQESQSNSLSTASEAPKAQSQILIKNLERTLNNEKLLREISYLIISDKPVKQISQMIARSLCLHLKIDRCLIHDYRDNAVGFVVEYCHNQKVKSILGENNSNFEEAKNHLEIRCDFYTKIKAESKKSSLFIIEDIKSDPTFYKEKEFYEKYSIASKVVAITAFDGQVNGGIYIHQAEKRSWTIDEIELIELITDQLAIAIDRSYSIEKVMVANHNLLEKTLELKEAIKKEKELRKVQSEFIALVSHEFKTPLQIIDSTRELIARKSKNVPELAADESFAKYLERIKTGIRRLNGLITSTLSLAKIEAGTANIKVEKQDFDLHDLIQDILEKTSNLAVNKGIKISIKFEGEKDSKLIINGDQKLLDHCFTNIISNAIKYSKDNSTVNIITRSSDDKVAVRVIDHGIGIPQDDLKNIGNKFFRAKNTLAVSGTGIGIYLTKYFVELHQGNVIIKSKLDVGTSVTVILPKQLH